MLKKNEILVPVPQCFILIPKSKVYEIKTMLYMIKQNCERETEYTPEGDDRIGYISTLTSLAGDKAYISALVSNILNIFYQLEELRADDVLGQYKAVGEPEQAAGEEK